MTVTLEIGQALASVLISVVLAVVVIFVRGNFRFEDKANQESFEATKR